MPVADWSGALVGWSQELAALKARMASIFGRSEVRASAGSFLDGLLSGVIERQRDETQLFVKEVIVAGIRYIVCRNEAEAEKDRADRQAIVAGLAQLKKGDKALIGNSAYQRFLRKSKKAEGQPAL